MKNKKMVLWLALIVMAIFPVWTQQYDSEKDFQIDWDENVKGGVIIAKYIGTKKEVSIPPRIQNNPVTGIGYEAFKDNRNITKVTIPNSVTSISGFSGCTGLTSINIPDNVKSIGYSAFRGCTGITSINIPNSVTSIGSDAFRGCTRLTKINIPNYVTSIGYGAFAGYTALTNITIPNSVTRIEGAGEEGWMDQRGAFENCTSLTSIIIPDSVTSIEKDVFSGCKSLTSVIIGNGVKSIGQGAFSNCTKLTEITIGNRVESIGFYAFSGCASLTSLTIPSSVRSIGRNGWQNFVFSGCDSLTSVTFQGRIYEFGSLDGFPGDLRAKYMASDGGPGTYTRFTGGNVWKKTSSPPVGNLGAFTIKMEDNFQYAQGYEARIVDANLLNGHQVTKGETYTLKVTYTTSRDLEGPVLVRLVDPSPEANWWRDLTPGDDSIFQIPASKANEVVSITVTLNTIASSTGSTPDKNIVVFTTNGKGVKGKQDSGVQKPFNIVFTEFVLTRIK